MSGMDVVMRGQENESIEDVFNREMNEAIAASLKDVIPREFTVYDDDGDDDDVVIVEDGDDDYPAPVHPARVPDPIPVPPAPAPAQCVQELNSHIHTLMLPLSCVGNNHTAWGYTPPFVPFPNLGRSSPLVEESVFGRLEQMTRAQKSSFLYGEGGGEGSISMATQFVSILRITLAKMGVSESHTLRDVLGNVGSMVTREQVILVETTLLYYILVGPADDAARWWMCILCAGVPIREICVATFATKALRLLDLAAKTGVRSVNFERYHSLVLLARLTYVGSSPRRIGTSAVTALQTMRMFWSRNAHAILCMRHVGTVGMEDYDIKTVMSDLCTAPGEFVRLRAAGRIMAKMSVVVKPGDLRRPNLLNSHVRAHKAGAPIECILHNEALRHAWSRGKDGLPTREGITLSHASTGTVLTPPVFLNGIGIGNWLFLVPECVDLELATVDDPAATSPLRFPASLLARSNSRRNDDEHVCQPIRATLYFMALQIDSDLCDGVYMERIFSLLTACGAGFPNPFRALRLRMFAPDTLRARAMRLLRQKLAVNRPEKLSSLCAQSLIDPNTSALDSDEFTAQAISTHFKPTDTFPFATKNDVFSYRPDQLKTLASYMESALVPIGALDMCSVLKGDSTAGESGNIRLRVRMFTHVPRSSRQHASPITLYPDRVRLEDLMHGFLDESDVGAGKSAMFIAMLMEMREHDAYVRLHRTWPVRTNHGERDLRLCIKDDSALVRLEQGNSDTGNYVYTTVDECLHGSGGDDDDDDDGDATPDRLHSHTNEMKNALTTHDVSLYAGFGTSGSVTPLCTTGESGSVAIPPREANAWTRDEYTPPVSDVSDKARSRQLKLEREYPMVRQHPELTDTSLHMGVTEADVKSLFKHIPSRSQRMGGTLLILPAGLVDQWVDFVKQYTGGRISVEGAHTAADVRRVFSVKAPTPVKRLARTKKQMRELEESTLLSAGEKRKQIQEQAKICRREEKQAILNHTKAARDAAIVCNATKGGTLPSIVVMSIVALRSISVGEILKTTYWCRLGSDEHHLALPQGGTWPGYKNNVSAACMDSICARERIVITATPVHDQVFAFIFPGIQHVNGKTSTPHMLSKARAIRHDKRLLFNGKTMLSVKPMQKHVHACPMSAPMLEMMRRIYAHARIASEESTFVRKVYRQLTIACVKTSRRALQTVENTLASMAERARELATDREGRRVEARHRAEVLHGQNQADVEKWNKTLLYIQRAGGSKQLECAVNKSTTDEEDGCPSCMNDFTQSIEPLQTQCGHVLCRSCTVEWFVKMKINKCPCCMQKVTQFYQRPRWKSSEEVNVNVEPVEAGSEAASDAGPEAGDVEGGENDQGADGIEDIENTSESKYVVKDGKKQRVATGAAAAEAAAEAAAAHDDRVQEDVDFFPKLEPFLSYVRRTLECGPVDASTGKCSTNGGKMLGFVAHAESLNVYTRHLTRMGLTVMTVGQLKQKNVHRGKVIVEFRSDASASVLMCLQRAAAAGIDMQIAQHVNVLEITDKLSSKAQMDGRVDREGQVNVPHTNSYIIPGTPDEYLFHRTRVGIPVNAQSDLSTILQLFSLTYGEEARDTDVHIDSYLTRYINRCIESNYIEPPIMGRRITQRVAGESVVRIYVYTGLHDEHPSLVYAMDAWGWVTCTTQSKKRAVKGSKVNVSVCTQRDGIVPDVVLSVPMEWALETCRPLVKRTRARVQRRVN